MQPFEVRVERQDGDLAVLSVSGDLDIATAPRVRAVVGDLMGAGVRRVEADLSGCRFADSCGLAALLWTAHRLRAVGGEFAVVHASRPVARTMAMTGLEGSIVIRD